jgi:hypothetical protein
MTLIFKLQYDTKEIMFSLGITSLQTNAYESSVQLEKYVQVMHPWL